MLEMFVIDFLIIEIIKLYLDNERRGELQRENFFKIKTISHNWIYQFWFYLNRTIILLKRDFSGLPVYVAAYYQFCTMCIMQAYVWIIIFICR